MTVALLPPRTSSSGGSNRDREPVPTGPDFIRNGRGGIMWHRPRSAVRYLANSWRPADYISYQLWCGSHAYSQHALTRERPPVHDEPVCGTCEGRAIGAGQVPGETPYATLFSPRWMEPPTRCPGSRTMMCEELGPRVGRCLVCGAIEPLRGGGGFMGTFGLTNHRPGPGIMEGCAFHGWQYIVAALAHEGTRIAVCRCQTERTA